MSFLTSHMLGSGPSFITILENTSLIRCKLLIVGDFQENQPTNRMHKINARQLHSPQSVRLSN